MNKGVALAVKAEALMYAARPLFNADAPYMQMADPANNEMIWLGGYDAKRWETARLANQEVIDWGKANGFELIDTGDPIKDYGTAVGTPSNREVLLAYKQQREADDNGIYKNYTFMPTHTGHDLGQYRGTGYGQLCQYRKADGTDQTWAGVDDWRPAGEYRDKAEELEPRAQASLYFYGVNPKNNTGNSRWDLYQNWQLEYKWQDGCAKNIKFWYEAGSREWFEFPIYRMAEFYLNIAEAYNEEGNPTMARMGRGILRGEPVVSPRPPLEAGGVDGRRGQVQVRVLAGRRRVVEPPQTRGVRQLHAQALLCPRIHVARAHVPFALYAQRGE